MTHPFVSVIIPCRNEERFIAKCIDSLAKQTYPKDAMEVMVVDGMSTDRTHGIISEYQKTAPFPLTFAPNVKKITATARNIGIANAKGEIICFFDAHAEYANDYISGCVEYLRTSGADAVGGMFATTPAIPTLRAHAIACVLSHRLGSGNSRFRVGIEKPEFVDTVFGACYKRNVFNRIGVFNERLVRSQDMEFNIRLTKAGGKILLVPSLRATYYPKSTLWDFFRHNISDGIWALYPLKITGKPLRVRHYIPFFFVASLVTFLILGFFFPIFFAVLAGEAVLYACALFYASWDCAQRKRDLRILLIAPIAFAMRHIGYGIGSFIGLVK